MRNLLWFLVAVSLAAAVQAYYRHTYEPQLAAAQEALAEVSHNLDDCQRQRDAAQADAGGWKSKLSDLTEQIASLTQQLSAANQATQKAVAEGNQWQAQVATLKEQMAAAARAQQQEATQPKREPKEQLVLTTEEIGDFEADRVRLDALFEQKQVKINKINSQTDPRSGGLIHPHAGNGYNSAAPLSVFHADDGSTTDNDIKDMLDKIATILTRFSAKQPSLSIVCTQAKAALAVYGEGYGWDELELDEHRSSLGSSRLEPMDVGVYEQNGDWRRDSQRIRDELTKISRDIDRLRRGVSVFDDT